MLEMKAALLNRRKFVLFSRSGKAVVVSMDLFKIHGAEAKRHPEGYRLSWIGFDPDAPKGKRLLFDSHPPKGPHFHVDDDASETPFTWESLKRTEALFFKMLCEHFDIDPEDIE